jgi:hypothetical protein
VVDGSAVIVGHIVGLRHHRIQRNAVELRVDHLIGLPSSIKRPKIRYYLVESPNFGGRKADFRRNNLESGHFALNRAVAWPLP